MNVVMLDNGDYVEVQGTAEGQTFPRNQLNQLLDYAEREYDPTCRIKENILVRIWIQVSPKTGFNSDP